MSFLKILNNNIKHDIWGNYLMTRQLGSVVGYGFLARKTIALARAMVMGRTITINDRRFFDTWNL